MRNERWSTLLDSLEPEYNSLYQLSKVPRRKEAEDANHPRKEKRRIHGRGNERDVEVATFSEVAVIVRSLNITKAPGPA